MVAFNNKTALLSEATGWDGEDAAAEGVGFPR